MNVESIVLRLEAVLSEERAAIARLDGARVATLNEEKRALAQALEGEPAAERRVHAARIKDVVRGLRRNGLLLAQARGILADVLATQGVARSRPEGRGFAARPPARVRHLSIKG